MRNIGKAVLLLLAAAWSLHAGVTAYVDSKQVQSGDSVTFTIESDTENTIFPTISKIGDYPVISSPSSKSIQNINGKVSARLSQSYVFQPIKDVTIPSFEVRADGTAVKTKPVTIKVSKRTQTLGEAYRFDIAVDKKNPYVGEEVELTATLTIDSAYNLEGLDLYLEQLEGFRVGSSDKNWRGNRKGDTIVFQRTFYLYPERSGVIEIPNYPIVGIASNGRARLFFNESKKFVAYSNSLSLDVKPLPGRAELVGSFALSVKTDRSRTKAGEPVNLTIMLAGKGNLDGFRGIDLKIDGVTVYGDKPQKNSERKNGVLNSSLSYKYALVSDANYTIPAFGVSFLDPKSGQIKEATTNPVFIEVKGGEKRKPVIVHVSDKKPGEEGKEQAVRTGGGGFLLFGSGLLLGVILGLLMPKLPQIVARQRERAERERSLHEKIKGAKTSKELLGYIIHMIGDDVLSAYIVRLEKGVSGDAFKAAKKEILMIMKEKGAL